MVLCLCVSVCIILHTAYFARAVSYECKGLMKMTTGVNVIQLYSIVNITVSWSVCQVQKCNLALTNISNLALVN
jgi:hypothetical protein